MDEGRLHDVGATTHVDALHFWLPFIFAATVYLTLLVSANRLLNDSDIYWHLAVGAWIVDHQTIPRSDPFSFTRLGAPWITSEWLAEVLFFGAFKAAGWAGPVILAAASIGATFFLLTRALQEKLSSIPTMIFVGAAIAMTAPHLLARPHVLVLPLMVLWAHATLEAAETRRAPSLLCLPLIALWANLHGSFTLGLALLVPFALEALCAADRSARRTLALQWLRFGLLAIGVACITPYGPEALLVTFRVLGLGRTLSTISEWQPLPLGSLGAVELCLLAGVAYALYSGLTLSPVRILVLLAIVHETFAHRRYVDVLALVVPLLVAPALAKQISQTAQPRLRRNFTSLKRRSIAAISALVGLTTWAMAAATDFVPGDTPSVAVKKLREAPRGRVLNEYAFGGYLIYAGIPVFIDSRAELYGAEYIGRYQRAISLNDVGGFVRLLDEYRISATLLPPSSPAVGLLDRMDGWERIYADNIAVAHARRGHAFNTNVSR